MKTRPIIFALSTMVGLAACSSPVPNTAPAPALGANDFPDAPPVLDGTPTPAPSEGAGTPAPGTAPSATPSRSPADAFVNDGYADITTPTKFKPDVDISWNDLTAGGSPGVTLDVYQTKGELELKETHLLVERARCLYDQLHVGQQIGQGRMDVGTPPKVSLDVTITVTDTDNKSYLVASVKAANILATIYLADLKFKQQGGNLSIVSVSNYARGNDKDDVHTTEASARVVQSLYGGVVAMPDTPGPVQVRTLLYSEPDPANGKVALRVKRDTLTLTP